MAETKYLYRVEFYEDNFIFCVSDGLVNGGLVYYEYPIIKETPCGVWISSGNMLVMSKEKWKWVSNKTKKRYAYPTKKEALEAYKFRKISQIRIITHQLNCAKTGLKLAEKED